MNEFSLLIEKFHYGRQNTIAPLGDAGLMLQFPHTEKEEQSGY